VSPPCGRQPRRGPRASWQITVLSADGERLVFATPCEDRKEAACLATEARTSNRRLRIFICDPYGDLSAWD
jgi:hypothetical protein